ncbi:MAG: 4Fe-4S binding protein [Methanomicrobiales archaeon]|nr:4Fe-4S binding protein [Methanomicrobiales archaeon]
MTLYPKFSKKIESQRDGTKMIMEQKLLQQKNQLVLNIDTCTGCGICVEACPEEAIKLGLVGAVRRGAVDYAAPIDVDEAKCSYCGVCPTLCPFSALSLLVDGEERYPIIEKEGFPTYDQVSKIDDEKCIKCLICEEICPRDAIDRKVDLYEGASKEGKERQLAIKTKTTFKVDMEKCTGCGICGYLCPAITVKRKPYTAETGKVEIVSDPKTGLPWDESKCDACKVCVEACPEECITVEREVVSDKIEGKVDIKEDLCCTCTWCSKNCPTEAITVEKLFDGEIEFFPEKCPAGCSTCVEVCPCNAIYLPTPPKAAALKGVQEAKIAVNKEYCMFCGACVNACPGEDIIVLKRNGIRVKGKETDLFKKIKEKLFTKRTSKVKEEVPPGQVAIKVIEKA